jgi:PilZ domain.
MQQGKTDTSFNQSSFQPEPWRRRSFRRCPEGMTAEIEIQGAGQTCQCQVVDLSLYGLGCLDCEASANLPPNATLIVWLTHAEDALLPVMGRVVHRHDYGSFRHLGIELESEGAEMVGIGSLV